MSTEGHRSSLANGGRAPEDAVGLETLRIMEEARRYNSWQYQRIAPYVGSRVCEIGAGIGNMSELLLRAPRDRLVLTDRDSGYLQILRRRFAAKAHVAVEQLELPDSHAADRFQGYGLDTIVALNVIEHVQDDLGALRTIRTLIPSGGRFIMLVPALPVLHGTLDQELGHFRRYTSSVLRDRLAQAGFLVQRVFYFNIVGALGWWFNARVLRRPHLAAVQVRCFDALVPFLQVEDHFKLPFGQSVISIATRV
ncbi:MAG: class I SAM-dependent methyltransferase [Gemmatimonadales bacterium]|nr:class I SAM-dependent methyltransferase [Gemmatimonadales bacterium]